MTGLPPSWLALSLAAALPRLSLGLGTLLTWRVTGLSRPPLRLLLSSAVSLLGLGPLARLLGLGM